MGFKGTQKTAPLANQPQHSANNTMLESSFQQTQYASRRIGPFSFDIDDDIDTEILTSEEVYKDLKDLDEILDKGEDSKFNLVARSLGRPRKKNNRKMF